MKKYILILLLFAVFDANCQYQDIMINLQPQPLSKYTIIIPEAATSIEVKAAKEFQHYFQKIADIQLDIIKDTHGPRPLEIVIGNCSRRKGFQEISKLDPDGFNIKAENSIIYISGGSDKGLLYGVYDFLEKFAGCRFYAPGVEECPKLQSISMNKVNLTESPAFRSREVYYAGMADQDFADKMRCDRNAWKGTEDWGMWVHTMFSLVPPDKYFDTHPEYFALMAGKREKTQLCLTNPDVLKITIEELRKKMQEKPNAKYWSVSQMDTYGYCECKNCQAIHKREGSPSGAIIEFVNKVAAAFPDKVISTLAYQFSRSAPKHIKPASNVNIMLCTIECDRNKPIASDTTTGSFYDDFKNWSKITKDILIWDYVIQFTNMIAPFPNLHVLQPNIQLFKKFNATAVFEQGCHGTYSENQELRQYVLAKLLWNPYLNLDSLENDFISSYYGNASKLIKKYIKAVEQAQVNSGKPLWIYGSPVEETNSFLTPELTQQYDKIFDEAEYSVSLDPEILARVKKARLPLRYSKIEIARKNIIGNDGFLSISNGKPEIKKSFTDQLTSFVDQANLYDVKSLHERGLTPDKYKEDVLNTGVNAFTDHLAINRSYQLKNPPGSKYLADGAGSLTDGKRGYSNFHILWQGFEGVNFNMVIDLGEVKEFNYLGAEFLQDITSWIFMPEFVQFYVSENGKKFTEAGKIQNTTLEKEVLPVIKIYDETIPLTKARYIKIFAKSLLSCPDWHIGHGGKSWIFIDEVIVQKHPLP